MKNNFSENIIIKNYLKKKRKPFKIKTILFNYNRKIILTGHPLCQNEAIRRKNSGIKLL